MEWFQTPNYVEGRTEEIDLIVIHATRSGFIGNDDRPGTINWFKNPRAQASSHRLYDTDGWVGGFVADWDTAWHAGYLNPRSLGAEVCQPTDDTPFTDLQVMTLAIDVRLWCEIHSIPKVRIFDENQCGIIGHDDTDQGQYWGKSDPGHMFPWDRFMEIVNMSEQELTTVKLQLTLVRLIAEGKGQEAFNIMKFIGMK